MPLPRLIYVLNAVFASSFAVKASAASIYPLEVGNRWVFSVSSTYPGCPDGEHAAEVLETVTISGREAFRLQSYCSGYPGGHVAKRDDGAVDAEYAGSWYRMIDAPVEDGHTWAEFRTRASWSSLGEITVRAGTFRDCWRKRRGVMYTDWTDYCRGVGPVRSQMIDLGGGWIETELVSYSLVSEHQDP